MDAPKVFISYSHDDEQHNAWVRELATGLRSNGVDVILDQWDLRLGDDLGLFMENGLTASDLVLCICSETYVKKFNVREGGVGYEGKIAILPQLVDASANYVISIIRNNPSKEKVPCALQGNFYIDFSDDNKYRENFMKLLERIHGEDIKKKPILGPNPFSNEAGMIIEEKIRIEKSLYRSSATSGTVVFRYDNNDGKYYIGSGEYEFETRWSQSGNNSIYAYKSEDGLIGYNEKKTDFPASINRDEFDCTSEHRRIAAGQIVIFMNAKHHFAAVKIISVKSSNHEEPYDEVVFEYQIYDEMIQL